MTDTDILIRCPLCGSIDVVEQKGMVTTTWKVMEPGKQAEVVEIKIYLCRQCGRTFNEMEE
jgi:DNA-directed RNA polymerase subunit RPC12/RpoP